MIIPTPEQQNVIDAVASGYPLIKIKAGAGTGKTSTLEQVCRVPAPGQQLYTQYLSDGVKDARRRFPRHVSCRTGHSLAWEWLDPELKARFNRDKPRKIRSGALADELGIRDSWVAENTRYKTTAAYASAMLQAVERFCLSEDDDFGPHHAPENCRDADERQAVVDGARYLWWDSTAGDGRFAPFSYNHYQKLWSLSRPRLPVARLLLDEAQDTNPCMGAVIRQQDHAQLIIVGDPNQAMYEWRGARNYMSDDKLMGGIWLPLTGSFRFGPEIADVANVFLEMLGDPMRLHGLGQPGQASRSPMPGLVPDAILCRTNAGCIEAAIGQLDAGRSVSLPKKLRGELLSFARGGMRLRSGRRSDHPELVNFRSWQEARDWAENEIDGAHMLVFVRLVETYGDQLVERLERMTDGPADVVCSTVHRSKGMEWPVVVCGDDHFPGAWPDLAEKIAAYRLGMFGGSPQDQDYRRRSLLQNSYVAVTRSERILDWHNLGWVQDGRMLQDGSGWGQDGSGI